MIHFSLTNLEIIDEFQSIKLEPNTAIVSEGWEESNQSYEDGGGSGGGPGPGGGGSSSGSTGLSTTNDDPLSLSLPLHSELSESSQLHESSRVSVNFFYITAIFLKHKFYSYNYVF